MMNSSFVVDLKATKYFPVSWGMVKQVGVSFSVDNVFGENYRAYYIYEDPGTVFSGQVSFKF